MSISRTGFGPLTEEMETVYFEEAHRRTIKKLKGGSIRKSSIGGTCIGCFVMILILIDVPKEDTESSKMQGILLIKTPVQKNNKVGAIISLLRREYGSVGFSWCLIKRVLPSTPPVR